VHRLGSIKLIRASLIRTLTASAVVAVSWALAGCNTDDSYQLPTRAMKELSPQTLALLEKKSMPKESPILVRLFKEESELEVWKQDITGRFQLLKVYPICRWSGDLGPKVHEGDRQAPEGFYTITPDLMQPNSSYYLAINTGFPNAYDRANDRHGAFLMIHGDCSSRGCYAMTDEQIGEIYSLARESFLGGQQSFQIQAYPFRMTPTNLARHRTNPNMAFWKMIKEGNDHFEVSHLEPKVEVCERHYVFDAQPLPNANKPVVFSPTGACPAFQVAPEIAGPALEKERNDDAQYKRLAAILPTAPVHSGLDGGMNRVFLAQVSGGIPPARVPPPQATGTAAVADTQQSSSSGGFFANIFGSKPAAQSTQVAASDPVTQERGGSNGFFGGLFSSNSNNAQQANAPATTGSTALQPAKPASAASLRPKPTTEPKPELRPQIADAAKQKPQQQQPQPQPKPQQEANAGAPGGGVLKGAQPVVPSGNFDSRWGALQ